VDKSAQNPGLEYSGWKGRDLDLGLPSYILLMSLKNLVPKDGFLFV